MYSEIKNFAELEAALRQLCDFLSKQKIDEDTVFESKLISFELVSNVLCHSDGIAYFMGAVKDGFVEIEVGSDERFVPPERTTCSDVNAERGRGLYLVDCFCERRIATGDGVKVFIRIKK